MIRMNEETQGPCMADEEVDFAPFRNAAECF